MEVDVDDVESMAALGEALTRLKLRSGQSLTQLACATTANGTAGLSRSTLNGYFKGRHLPQQGVGAEFRRLLLALGVDNHDELDEWWAKVEWLRGTRAGSTSPANPYPGLRSFDTHDSTRFFGRSALTTQLATRITTEDAPCGQPIVVVGPSGAGKSSLLRAGLAPALATDGWEPIVLTPTSSSLLPVLSQDPQSGLRRVLIVDQFEELFTSEIGDDREHLVAAICSRARSMPTVLGLRADFYAQALHLPELATAVQQSQCVVAPLHEPELREAISEPAQVEGLRVDQALVELLLREMAPGHGETPTVAHEQGALPLLSHVMRVTFESVVAAGGTTLTVQAYRSTGGIRHAIADTAESVYAELTSRGKQLTRQLFRRLTHVGEGTADIRRTVDREELFGQRSDAEIEELDNLLDVLLTRRLLTTDDASVRISHEALLTAWPRLRGWLDDDRAGRRLHHRLTNAAREWRDGGRGEDDLYQGKTLTMAQGWAAEDGHDHLNPLEREFLDVSLRKRDAEQATARRRVRRRYQLSSLAAVLAVLVAATTLYAWQSKQEADAEARAGLSRNISAKATRLRDTDPALAAQLAAVAYRSAPTVEAHSALLDSVAVALPVRGRGPDGHTDLIAATPKAAATVGANGTIALTKPGGSGPVRVVGHLEDAATAVALSDDSRLLAVASADGSMRLWDVDGASDPKKLATFAGPVGDVASVRFSPDRTMLAAGGEDGTVRLWRLPSQPGEPSWSATLLNSKEDAITSVAFGPHNTRLVAGGRNGTVYRFELSNPLAPRQLSPLTGPQGQVFSVAVAPNGTTVAAGAAKDRAVYLWDVSEPDRPGHPKKLTGPASWVTSIDFSTDGRRLAAASSDATLWQWDLTTSQPLNQLPHPGVVTTALYVDDTTVLTLAEDGVVRRWPATQPTVDEFGDTIYSVAFRSGGKILAVGPGDGNAIRLIDVSEPGSPAPVGDPILPRTGELTGPLALNVEGTLLAAGTANGQVFLWDTTNPARPRQISHGTLHVGDAVTALDMRDDTLAVATQAGKISLIDVEDPEHSTKLSTITASTATLNDVRFNPKGAVLAAGSDDGNTYLYDVNAADRPRRVATLNTGDAASVAFNADGTILAVGSSADDNVHLWNMDDPSKPTRMGTPLDGPVGDPYQLTFHPDGNHLAAASIDGTVWSWEISNPDDPQHIATFAAPSDAVTALEYAPQGTQLAGGSRDGDVYLWPTDPKKAISEVCARTGDTITETEWRQFLPDAAYQPPC